MNKAISSYQRNQVAGMSQKDLIVLLYSGAVKFLDQAREELDKQNVDAFADRIERVHRIVQHLYTTLNLEAGEIAEKLAALYAFVISQLFVLNSTRNPAIIEDLRVILSNLKDAWQQVEVLGTASGTSARSGTGNREQDKLLSLQV